MSKYAIISHMKVKGANAFTGLLLHNSRTLNSKNIDRERTDKNITLLPFQYSNYEDFVEQKKTEIRLENKRRRKAGEKIARFPRQQKQRNKKTGEIEMVDAALMSEYAITLSRDALGEEEAVAYLRDAYDFFCKHFEGQEILYGEIHLDETTPHLHIGVSYYDKNDKRFVQKELQKAGKTDIDRIRDLFQEQVANKYNLIRQDGEATKGRYDGRKASIEAGEIRKQEREKVKEEIYTGSTRKIGKLLIKETWKQRAERAEKRIEELENKPEKIVEVEKVVEVPVEKVVEKVVEVEVESGATILRLKKKVEEQEKEIRELKTTIKNIVKALKTLPHKLFQQSKAWLAAQTLVERETIKATGIQDKQDEQEQVDYRYRSLL